MYLGQDQIWGQEFLLKTWPHESIFFSMTTCIFPEARINERCHSGPSCVVWCIPLPPAPSHLTPPKTLEVIHHDHPDISGGGSQGQRGEASCPRSPKPTLLPLHLYPSASVKWHRGHGPGRERRHPPPLGALVRTGFRSLGERKGPKPEVPTITGNTHNP